MTDWLTTYEIVADAASSVRELMQARQSLVLSVLNTAYSEILKYRLEGKGVSNTRTLVIELPSVTMAEANHSAPYLREESGRWIINRASAYVEAADVLQTLYNPLPGGMGFRVRFYNLSNGYSAKLTITSAA